MRFKPMRNSPGNVWEFNNSLNKISTYHRIKFVSHINDDDPDFTVLRSMLYHEMIRI